MPIVVVGLVSARRHRPDRRRQRGLRPQGRLVDVEQILFVVLYGIGTDYILFFLFRYRERLREGEEKRDGRRARPGAGRRGDRLGRRRGDRRLHGADPQLARHLPGHRSGAGHRRRRDPDRLADPGARPSSRCSARRSSGRRRSTWSSPSRPASRRSARASASHPLRFALASGGVLAILAVFAFSFNPSLRLLGDSSLPQDAESTSPATSSRSTSRPAPATRRSSSCTRRRRPDRRGRRDGVRRPTSARRTASQRPCRRSRTRTARRTSSRVPARRQPDGDEAIADIKDSVRPAAHAAAPAGTRGAT